MAITNINFRKVVDKTDPHVIPNPNNPDDKGELLVLDGNRQAYLLEAIEYADGSYAPVTIIDGNDNQLVEGTDYILKPDAALITFQVDPIMPCRARYTGVGSIIWAHDVRELQDAVSNINGSAVNKNGDVLQGSLNVNGYNIANVSTINNIPLWTHNHSVGDGDQIPTNGIQNNAITTIKILNGNVTNSKIANDAITNEKISNNAITNEKISNNEITNNKLVNNTIEIDKINKSSLLNALYPVGSIYISLTNNCPIASSLGGTWVKIEAGYYLQQKLSNKNLGDLVEAGLPNITGTISPSSKSYNPTGAFYKTSNTHYYTWSLGTTNVIGFDASRSSSVYGNSNTVQTNAIEVNIWKRVL